MIKYKIIFKMQHYQKMCLRTKKVNEKRWTNKLNTYLENNLWQNNKYDYCKRIIRKWKDKNNKWL